VVKLFREKGYRGTVGCILNPEVTYPRSRAPHDVRAAEIYDLFYNRVFLDPLVHGVYPPELFTLLEQHQVTWDYSEEELAIIRDNTVDELGINLYYPHRVKAHRAPGIRRRRSIRLIIMSRLSCRGGG
jgi:beta-glucosidase